MMCSNQLELRSHLSRYLYFPGVLRGALCVLSLKRQPLFTKRLKVSVC
ncbi:hypothetical protein KCP77_18805 [Salmonella enterica subsp. enterica]|nr:hypothetical protein KCP77_18805 [Salmonella enterica subsp. enterica]